MRAFIVGCGRVGAGLAEQFATAGHEVTIVDARTEAFDRLPEDFTGRAVRGDGTDEEVLRRAGAEGADLFLALTEGDNRNVLAAQMAAESLGAKRSVAKINDPVRAEAYAAMGIATICRTTLLVDALAVFAGLPADATARGVRAPTGQHPGGGHDQLVSTPIAPASPESATLDTAGPASLSSAGPVPTAEPGPTDPGTARAGLGAREG